MSNYYDERRYKDALNKILSEIELKYTCYDGISNFTPPRRQAAVFFHLPKKIDIKELPNLFEPEPVSLPNLPIKQGTVVSTGEIKKLENLVLSKKEKYGAILEVKYQNMRSILDNLKSKLNQQDELAIAELIELAHQRHELPPFLRRSYKANFHKEKKLAYIEFEFPDYKSEKSFSHYLLFNKMTEKTKKLYIQKCLYSLIIRSAYLSATCCPNNAYELVVINVFQKWFDTATGQPKEGVIASLQASVEILKSLNLENIDPEQCFKYLKGISTPSLQNISPIRPIFILNTNDDRVVAKKDIESTIEYDTNLALMNWEDFEHLIAQLFEWEFSKKGMEIKVTRASRDRGVDAILFDENPLTGGKYIIQAKRYTRTVDVSAVRDLYGTVVNEGANRGILVTTSSYGPDAYEFAKDKPISLVDGPNLLMLLQKHGKKFKIDLVEARARLSEMSNSFD